MNEKLNFYIRSVQQIYTWHANNNTCVKFGYIKQFYIGMNKKEILI